MTAYTEEFVYDVDNPAAPCFACSVCGTGVDLAPCPDHGPGPSVGPLVEIPCDATPAHRGYYVIKRDDYGTPCPMCTYTRLMEAHAGCEHKGHGRWRRWKATRKLAVHAYVLGIISGSSTTFSADCNGCLTRVSFKGPRPYILGVPSSTWRCLIQGRHWPAEHVAWGFCTRCLPCGDCGSKTWEHTNTCPEGN